MQLLSFFLSVHYLDIEAPVVKCLLLQLLEFNLFSQGVAVLKNPVKRWLAGGQNSWLPSKFPIFLKLDLAHLRECDVFFTLFVGAREL